MEEGHGSWRRKEKGRYPRKKRLKNSASPQPARGSSALCLQCLLPPHFPGQGTTGWFYLNCYQGKFLNYTGWWGWLKKCPVSQPWKKSQVSYCTLLPQQFRLLLGFKCLWRLFFFCFLCVYVRTCALECRCIQRPEEGVRALGGGIQAIMSRPAWGLETELGSFAKIVSLHSQFKYLQICRLMKQGNSRNFTFSNAQKQNYLKDVVLWLFCSLFRHKL